MSFDPCNNCNKPYPCCMCEHYTDTMEIYGYPNAIMCENTLYKLGAVDEKGDAYYLSSKRVILRANDLYVPRGATIPFYKEYAVNGLFFCYDEQGELEEYVKEMLTSPRCKVFTEQMRDIVAKEKSKVPFAICNCCGLEIHENDTYAKIDGHYYCDYCGGEDGLCISEMEEQQ